MQALIEMIIGFIALIATVALSQFGLQLDAPKKSEREIYRVRDCPEPRGAVVLVAARSSQDC